MPHIIVNIMKGKRSIFLLIIISSLYCCKETSNEIGLEQHSLNLEADSATVTLKVKKRDYWVAGCRTIINDKIEIEKIPEENTKFIKGKWFSFNGNRENQIILTFQPNDTIARSVIFELQYLDWYEELQVNQKGRIP